MRAAYLLPLLSVLVSPCAAQTPRGLPLPRAEVDLGVRLGDQAHLGLRPLDALQALRGVLDADPIHYGALWRAARETVSLGMLAVDGHDREARYEQAEEYARRAVVANPEGAEGHRWLAIALGQRALGAGPRTKVKLANEIRTVALRTLELDSLDAGAHHVLGEWNAQIERLNSVTRWAAERLLGATAFDEASWEEAESRMRRAIELEPDHLIHRMGLAGILWDTGRREEAREQWREVIRRPAVEPTDPLHRQRAQELLGRS